MKGRQESLLSRRSVRRLIRRQANGDTQITADEDKISEFIKTHPIDKVQVPTINKTIRNKDKTDLKVALCAMAKMENRYLREWVEYHLSIGFDHIFIYDNNDKNAEHCEDCLSPELLDSVTIIDYRGKIQGDCKIQVLAYQDCYNKLCKGYDWVSFLDIDEFMTFTQHADVKDYLADPVFRKFDSIRISWLCYDDNDHLKYEDKPVVERFTRPCSDNKVNEHYKSFFRTNISNLRFPNVHYSTEISEMCNNCGKKIKWNKSTKLFPVTYEWAFIRHYCTKSLEEYITIKKKRRNKGSSERRLSQEFFWKYNSKTKEKVELMNKLWKTL